MYYVEVGVGVERHWKSAVFIYETEQQLSAGDLVRVPFGPKKKAGVVIAEARKPTFSTKAVYEILPCALSEETLGFMDWFRRFYELSHGDLYSLFLPSFISKATKNTSTQIESSLKTDISLTKAQDDAYEKLRDSAKPSVLQGITGSGKTRIYTKLITETLSGGKNALFLYPEISLTSQLVQELEKHATVLTFHSGMTAKQRSDLWVEVALSTEPLIVAGPRSSLFLPHHNLGLIIIDEAHEGSYYQETGIRYNGLLVAGGLAKAHSAKLVLGSATPPINEVELIQNNGGVVVELHEKAITAKHRQKIIITDLKDKGQFKKHHLLSDELLTSIAESLSEGKQSLLFLNRRGTAKLLLCDTCEWQQDCPNCDLPLTYHHDVYRMICHTCGNRERVPTSCPACGGEVSTKSLGSKALIEEVQKLFPEAKIGRFDSDTNQSDSFTDNYKEIRAGSIDILIGTQQIVKGVDLPLLRTVGVLQADLSLHFPDYTSNERTFQLISQVLGRINRGHGESEAFIQTYNPTNPVLELATREDWSAFRVGELADRKQHDFPPYVFIAKLVFREKSLDKAMKQADAVKKNVLKKDSTIKIDGPISAFYGKKGGYYYVQLLVRGKKRSDLLRACADVPLSVIKDFDPSTLL